jgi:S-layer homology domain
MRKTATVFLISIVALLLFSSMTVTSRSQANSSGLDSATLTPTACISGWNVVTSPSPGTGDKLNGVAAITSRDVWAVGEYDSSTQNTLTEHWDGNSWSVVSSPSPGTTLNTLQAVTVISTSNVWAVGEYTNGNNQYTLVEHWNGTSWSVVPSPSPGTIINTLRGVSAISQNDVWAVGNYYTGTYNALVEHWDGSSWSIIPSPDTYDGGLSGVTAISPNDVWAVGARMSGGNVYTLVEHWDGTSWSIIPSLSPGRYGNGLYGIAAISSRDIWTVGDARDIDGDSTEVSYTIVERWHGGAWALSPSVSPDQWDNHLFSVSVISPASIWAVGAYGYASGQSGRTLAEHWDGSSWSVVTSPSPGTRDNALQGVAAISQNDVWAVGSYVNNGSTDKTLVEHYSGSGCATPSPTACAIPFTDISGNIFYNAITYLYCGGAVNGTDATHYSPALTSTRAQFAKTVVLAFGLTLYTPNSGQDFTDVPPGYFAYLYIETGYHAAILSGFDANGCAAHGATYPCYLPSLPITRGQLTKLVVNAAHYPLITPSDRQPTFTDVPWLHVFFLSIETAYMHGVISGYPDGSFRPNNPIRRDEMAQIVYKGMTTP